MNANSEDDISRWRGGEGRRMAKLATSFVHVPLMDIIILRDHEKVMVQKFNHLLCVQFVLIGILRFFLSNFKICC